MEGISGGRGVREETEGGREGFWEGMKDGGEIWGGSERGKDVRRE